MGRIEKSKSLAPPAVRKDIRAKQARYIINKVVPAVLASNSRARKGSEGSELIVDPQHAAVTKIVDIQGRSLPRDNMIYAKRKGQGRRRLKMYDSMSQDSLSKDEAVQPYQAQETGNTKFSPNVSASSDDWTTDAIPRTPCKLRIINTDSLTAGHMLTFPCKYTGTADALNKSKKKQPNVCLLNMASPLRPGGGVLSGATSQEEFLCARTTLLPSLKETFYRLPELGGIYTKDVLVLRSALPLGNQKDELAITERWWVDVLSAAMLRFPELEGEEDQVKTLNKRDLELVEAKMKSVIRIAAHKGVRRLVLGAWGCGAFGNPVTDIAKAWRKVLDGCGLAADDDIKKENKKKKNRDTSSSSSAEGSVDMEEIVFAITSRNMADRFATAFGGDIEVEIGPQHVQDEEDEDEDEDEDSRTMEELENKITELRSQLNSVWNPDLKRRMESILQQLQSQLHEIKGEEGNYEKLEESPKKSSEVSREDKTMDKDGGHEH